MSPRGPRGLTELSHPRQRKENSLTANSRTSRLVVLFAQRARTEGNAPDRVLELELQSCSFFLFSFLFLLLPTPDPRLTYVLTVARLGGFWGHFQAYYGMERIYITRLKWDVRKVLSQFLKNPTKKTQSLLLRFIMTILFKPYSTFVH